MLLNLSMHCKKCGVPECPRGAILSCFRGNSMGYHGKYCSPGVFRYTTFFTVCFTSPTILYLFLTVAGIHQKRNQRLNSAHFTISLLQKYCSSHADSRMVSRAYLVLIPAIIACNYGGEDFQECRSFESQLFI